PRVSLLLSVFPPLSTPAVCVSDTPPAHLYTLSLHDALPISARLRRRPVRRRLVLRRSVLERRRRHHHLRRSTDHRTDFPACRGEDRKSTRLNSSHQIISYAVFCLKKKKKILLKY